MNTSRTIPWPVSASMMSIHTRAARNQGMDAYFAVS
jgi:hypothetical protein